MGVLLVWALTMGPFAQSPLDPSVSPTAVLDLRTALRSKGETFEIDPRALRAAGVLPDEFVAPTRVKDAAPTFPATAKAAGVQGTVGLECRIGIDGKVSDCRVSRSLHADLDETTLRAVRQWRYRPAQIKGVERAIRVRIDVTYRLQ